MTFSAGFWTPEKAEERRPAQSGAAKFIAEKGGNVRAGARCCAAMPQVAAIDLFVILTR
jgi:hypothetical protein